ncbi:hypothetical protein LCI18_005137 [Fusarium solani-melongenae]|uniref:Uncharacterized protein n=1 Tax=Fusarium solani subsp. cucurbitae TaxID=2747967 RepID=A0ACD3YZ11_FUSSC|nr:hypothetical protein LCI18_005137 [Fusarium solani-melongenae]
MNQKRIWSYDQTATSSLPPPPKRQKVFQCNSSDTLPHNRYTIAWICALYREMTTARAMLDEIHPDLPQDDNDTNRYMLGSIGPQNVVIACLPDSQYGTTSATNVLTNLRRTYPSARKGFMVGVGGGVPNKADLCLGDVVVGIRVMPYDLGKVVEGGKVQRTVVPKSPDQALLTVVSDIRAQHRLVSNRVSTILRDMAVTNPEFRRPTSPDRLFLPTYSHDPRISCCSGCDQSKLLPRSKRSADDPNIHYGAIASGNHVMKDSTTRDKLARELDIICFEMEAAGLMDVLPCLPIRGICDYSDSHKSKEWQDYAAAAAATYAKVFIEMLPVSNRTFENLHSPSSPSQDALPDRRQLLLESLRFEQIYSRKISINKAHSKTCHWFLKLPQYLEWVDPQKHAHRGFLWMRGKPGSGKSTIMKFIYREMKTKRSPGDAITASFFFYARGEDLEKSIQGMYRSLLLQLLEGYPDLQNVLDDAEFIPRCQTGCPPLNVLKDLFHNAVSNLGQRTFTCFIDALDECDEQQVMEMVCYFEELAESCVCTGVQLRICFSSRHYPYIHIRRGIELSLEHQPGHDDDMSNYIESNLRITSTTLIEKLRHEMIEKASGVFLWVVLVVGILNNENRRGRPALQKRLAEVPSGLTELFKDILRRDKDNMEDLLLSVLWILCAKRPLRPEEYYHALWSRLAPQDLSDDAASDSNDRFERFVISSSKGLAEITKVKKDEIPTVQFIHESVRDFLVKDRGLQELWPGLGFDWQSQGHERLKQYCSMYLNSEPVRACFGSIGPKTQPSDLLEQYPFLEYASQYVLYHSDAAAQTIPQAEFLCQTSTVDWATTLNLFEKFKIRRYGSTASLIYILADKGFSALIGTWLQDNPSFDIRGERYERPLFAAVANGHKHAVAALLKSTLSICEGVDSVEGFGSKTSFVNYKGRTLLTWAAQVGLTSVVEHLVQKEGADVNEIDQHDCTPILRASTAGHQAVVSFLIEKGVAVESARFQEAISFALPTGRASILKLLINVRGNWYLEPIYLEMGLRGASKRKSEEMVKFLIEDGVELVAKDSWRHTALSLASENYHAATLKLLIEQYSDWDFNSKGMQTAFRESAAVGNDEMVKLLVAKGVEVDAQSSEGCTALAFASSNSHLSTVKLLIESGARINPDAKGSNPRPALIEASKNGHVEIVRLLFERGANIETRDEDGRTALIAASIRGHETLASLLIEQGASVNAHDKDGKSPLHHIVELDEDSSIAEPRCEAFAKLLLRNGASIDARDFSGQTPLLTACRDGRKAVQRLLIEQGAYVNARDKAGNTPLIWACQRDFFGEPLGQPLLLIEKGADVNAMTEQGFTPLHGACQLTKSMIVPDLFDLGADTVPTIIDKGADIHAQDGEGSTPLHLAVSSGLPPQFMLRVVKLLVERGANVNDRNNKGDTPESLAKKKRLRADDPLMLALKGL